MSNRCYYFYVVYDVCCSVAVLHLVFVLRIPSHVFDYVHVFIYCNIGVISAFATAREDKRGKQVSGSLSDMANCKFRPKISRFAQELQVPEFLERLKGYVQQRKEHSKRKPAKG